MGEKDILEKFLPKIIVDWFDITCIEDDELAKRMDLYLDEKKIIPDEIKHKQVVSDGFYTGVCCTGLSHKRPGSLSSCSSSQVER